ncbi:toxin C-terminal domain-containing protein [Clostridium beijerinckii]|uniref:toxin C-terminal domain-containing protein n=1 Tax=Clostridium beijerinckii TaxID=1520 RepID=UPI000366A7C9|nr:toxin C-terminal domain-containing protein [Clostridium beijerinckii]
MHSKIQNNSRLIDKHPIPKIPPEGYIKINQRSRCNQSIYYNQKDKTYITPDIDQHNGGYWKMAYTPDKLNRKNTRLGTYNENLSERIGD